MTSRTAFTPLNPNTYNQTPKSTPKTAPYAISALRAASAKEKRIDQVTTPLRVKKRH